MKEYNVSFRKPNKKYAIKKEDRITRIKDYLKTIWTVRKYFIDKYEVVPPAINGHQMPSHRHGSASQETLSLKSEEVFVKDLCKRKLYVFKRKGYLLHTALQ